MLACNEIVTVVHGTGSGYECAVFSGVSWYDKTAVAMEGSGLAFDNMVKIRIPVDSIVAQRFPEVGDHVIRGAVHEIASPADLATHAARRIMSVGDNRRGQLQHLAVIAK